MQRYELKFNGGSPDLFPVPDGKWVLASEAEARVAGLEAELRAYKAQYDTDKERIDAGDRFREALVWALGAGEDFPERQPGQRTYWWRPELQKRAGLLWDGEKFIPE